MVERGMSIICHTPSQVGRGGGGHKAQSHSEPVEQLTEPSAGNNSIIVQQQFIDKVQHGTGLIDYFSFISWLLAFTTFTNNNYSFVFSNYLVNKALALLFFNRTLLAKNNNINIHFNVMCLSNLVPPFPSADPSDSLSVLEYSNPQVQVNSQHQLRRRERKEREKGCIATSAIEKEKVGKKPVHIVSIP